MSDKKYAKAHVVFDCETLSVEPNAAIMSVGWAVVVEGDEPVGAKIIDSGCKTIDMEIYNEYTGDEYDISVSTIMWWLQQSDEARAALLGGKSSLFATAREISEMIVALENVSDEVMVYGYGSNADIVWLENMFKVEGLDVPWSYRSVRCLRTVLADAGVDLHDYRSDDSFSHTALGDAITEALALVSVLQARSQVTAEAEGDKVAAFESTRAPTPDEISWPDTVVYGELKNLSWPAPTAVELTYPDGAKISFSNIEGYAWWLDRMQETQHTTDEAAHKPSSTKRPVF